MHDLTRPLPSGRGPEAEPLFPTVEETIGPYYPAIFAMRFAADAPTPTSRTLPAAGEPMRLSGRIRDVNGDPVPAALVETWQADGRGRYPGDAETRASGAFLGFSRQYVNDGRYEVLTMLPGPVLSPNSGEPSRAPHITLTLFCDGIAKLVTQIFFENEPLNGIDPVLCSLPEELRPRLIARRVASEDMRSYERDILLRGGHETPFFDIGR